MTGPRPRSQYSDVQPNTNLHAVLQYMTTTGITAYEALELGLMTHTASITTFILSLETMHGYDVRRLKLPHKHPRSIAGKVLYFIAGRHNWEHTKYEDFIDPNELRMKENIAL